MTYLQHSWSTFVERDEQQDLPSVRRSQSMEMCALASS